MSRYPINDYDEDVRQRVRYHLCGENEQLLKELAYELVCHLPGAAQIASIRNAVVVFHYRSDVYHAFMSMEGTEITVSLNARHIVRKGAFRYSDLSKNSTDLTVDTATPESLGQLKKWFKDVVTVHSKETI